MFHFRTNIWKDFQYLGKRQYCNKDPLQKTFSFDFCSETRKRLKTHAIQFLQFI